MNVSFVYSLCLPSVVEQLQALSRNQTLFSKTTFTSNVTHTSPMPIPSFRTNHRLSVTCHSPLKSGGGGGGGGGPPPGGGGGGRFLDLEGKPPPCRPPPQTFEQTPGCQYPPPPPKKGGGGGGPSPGGADGRLISILQWNATPCKN